MSNKDERASSHLNITKTIVVLVFVLGSIFLVENLAVFYFKFNNASAENGFNLRKKVDYLTYQYVDYFKNVSKYDVANFQSYINDSAMGDVLLLKIRKTLEIEE